MMRTISTKSTADTTTPILKTPHFLHIGIREKVLLLKHLTVMLDAGIPLRDALKAVREQKNSPSLQFIIQSAIKDTADGRQLSFTLNNFPHLFDPFFVSAIEVGESSGTLPKTLQYLAVQTDKSQRLQSQIRNALIYPVIILLGAIGISIYLSFFLLPQILPLFSTLNVKLPLSTRLLLGVTGFIHDEWLLILIAVGILSISLVLIWKFSKRFRYAMDFVFLHIPVFGTLLREVQISQFARILGTLLTSSVQIVPALRVTAHSASNLVFRRYLEDLTTMVERGETITNKLIKQSKLFSRTAASMVAMGEQTGTLPRSLLALAEFSEREIEDMTKNITTLIEPIVLLAVGLLVGFIAISIITPIYQLTQGITH